MKEFTFPRRETLRPIYSIMALGCSIKSVELNIIAIHP